VFNALPCLHIHPTSLPGGTGKRWLGVGGHDLVSGCPEHWVIQPSAEICAKVHYMITMHTHLRQMDGLISWHRALKTKHTLTKLNLMKLRCSLSIFYAIWQVNRSGLLYASRAHTGWGSDSEFIAIIAWRWKLKCCTVDG